MVTAISTSPPEECSVASNLINKMENMKTGRGPPVLLHAFS